MLIRILGNDEGDTIIFDNGMKIEISYEILAFKDNLEMFKWGERFTADARRVTLYDSEDNILTDLIEPNPDEREVHYFYDDDPSWLKK